jgi:uncharacterized protein YneF (UPF0154 family)
MQILKSGNPMQSIMNMMTPQQKIMAQTFLNNPNREQALKDLMQQNGVTQEQVEQVTKIINS